MRKWIKISLWIFTIIVFLIITVLVVNIYGENKCRNIQIIINAPEGSGFLNEADVMSYLNAYGDSLVGNNLSRIDLEKIEEIINSKPYVLRSKVYLTLNGLLKIDIKQRNPIARIQNIHDSSYYISDDGRLMPLTNGKTARVVFVNGQIKNLYFDLIDLDIDSTEVAKDSLGFITALYRVYRVAKFINNNEFYKAQIQQIYVDENSNLILFPELGEHMIIFGDEKNLEEKFQRLEIFYKKAMFIQGWDKYDTINVKYKNQIICS